MCLWSALFVGWVGGVWWVGSDSFERLNVIDPAMGFVMVKLVDVTVIGGRFAFIASDIFHS
jgi:hypothetical protein